MIKNIPLFYYPMAQNNPKSMIFERLNAICIKVAAKDLPLSLHSKFETTFDALQNSGLFLYDAVQPGGKKVSKTFVKRTLIGKPGSTYRYLGLRLFSHPWCSVSSDGDDAKEQDASSLQQLGYKQTCAEAQFGMGILNQL